MTYVSDIITEDEMKSWEPGLSFILSAPMGRGKTRFAIDKLGLFAKKQDQKVLLLTNRKPTHDQNKRDINAAEMSDTVAANTYQHVDACLEKGNEINLDLYKYIICDEFHYFLQDSGYNPILENSFSTITNDMTAVKIFISATADDTAEVVKMSAKGEIKELTIPPDWSFIDQLIFFDSNDQIYNIVDDCLEKGEKAICFMNNVDEALKLHNCYKKNSIFFCSESNKNAKEMDIELRNKVVMEGTFSSDLLITTSVLDAGVSFKGDPKVKNIILDIKDVTSLVQCIGRRRIKPGEKLNIYIHNITKRELLGHLQKCNKLVEEAHYFLEAGKEKYLRTYIKNGNFHSAICKLDYKGNVSVRYLYYYKLKADINRINKILNAGGWSKYLSALFGKARTCQAYNDIFLKNYLEKNEGKIYPKRSDREEIIEAVGLKDNSNRLVRNVNKINEDLINRGFPYQLLKKDMVINGTRCQSAWILTQIT